MEEIELLKRCMQEIRTTYNVDPEGLSSEGSAPDRRQPWWGSSDKRMVRGLWIANGGVPRGLRMPQAEPMESISFLLQGDNASYKTFSESLIKIGYRVLVDPEPWSLEAKGDKSIKNGSVKSRLTWLLWIGSNAMPPNPLVKEKHSSPSPGYPLQRTLTGLFAIVLTLVAVAAGLGSFADENTAGWIFGVSAKLAILLTFVWLAWPQLIWLMARPVERQPLGYCRYRR